MLISLWKLRRLSSRALRVLDRRKEDVPAIAAYEPTLKPHAEAYRAKYDEAARYESMWQKEMAEGRSANAELVKLIRMWIPLVARDVPGFTGAGLLGKPEVPDDVLTDASRLINTAIDYQAVAEQENALPYLETLTSQLNAAVTAAAKETREAEDADQTYQSLLREVREAGAAFNQDLKAFRRTLGNAVGRSDRDYQKLRAERAHATDEDDDADAPPTPEPPPVADPNTPPPSA
jgi:hypothetical protein